MRTAVFLLAAATALPGRSAEASCTPCHTKAELAPKHAALKHEKAPLTCTTCHRGDENAAEAAAAHVKSGPQELLAKERVSAACARCHVPGAEPGTELLVTGAKYYLDLGCAYCHRAIAPPLAAIGIRGSEYLTRVVREPASVFKGTVMPAYASELDRSPEKAKALIAYLLSMTGPNEQKPIAAAAERCATCHATKPAPNAPKHRCALIREEAKELSCKRCHAKSVPASERECLYIDQRRRDCGVCHDGGVHGR